jgi:hypothetical protein
LEVDSNSVKPQIHLDSDRFRSVKLRRFIGEVLLSPRQMMLPLLDCPLNGQSGLGKARDKFCSASYMFDDRKSGEHPGRIIIPGLQKTINDTRLRKHQIYA